MKKLLAISLALFLMLFLLFSCSVKTDEPKLVPFELTEDYQVIRPEVTDERTLKSAIGLRNTIEEGVGKALKLSTDWIGCGEEVPVGTKEILVGGTNRHETTNAAASLRRNDFVIKKDGERIVILGGSPEATEEAVNFFIEKCISDGKLMLPEDEYIRGGEYAVDKLTLNGHDIRKVSIEADGTLTTSRKGALEVVKDMISGLCGWEPGCDGSEYTIRIKAEPYGDPDTYTFAPDDSELVIGGNGEFSLLLALNDLASRIQTDGSKELDVMHRREKCRFMSGEAARVAESSNRIQGDGHSVG